MGNIAYLWVLIQAGTGFLYSRACRMRIIFESIWKGFPIKRLFNHSITQKYNIFIGGSNESIG